MALQTLKMSPKGHRWKEDAEATPSGVRQHRVLGSESRGASQSNDFSEPRLCILPNTEKH